MNEHTFFSFFFFSRGDPPLLPARSQVDVCDTCRHMSHSSAGVHPGLMKPTGGSSWLKFFFSFFFLFLLGEHDNLIATSARGGGVCGEGGIAMHRYRATLKHGG